MPELVGSDATQTQPHTRQLPLQVRENVGLMHVVLIVWLPVLIIITACCLSEAWITTTVETPTMRGCPGATPPTLKLAGSTAR